MARAFITVADGDKPAATGVATILHDLGFEIVATRGTAQAIRKMGIPAETINKIGEGSPHVVDWIERGEVDLVINTPVGTGARADGYEIRSAAIARGIPCITTMAGGMAAARAISAARGGEPEVVSLQEIHAPHPEARARMSGTLAPFGRRAATVTAREEHGAYVVIRCHDAGGPRARAGQFYMLASGRAMGRGRASGRSCRAPSASFALRDGASSSS